MFHTNIETKFKPFRRESIMMKYKRIMIVVMSLSLLAGCASENESNEDSPQPNETVGQGGGMKSGGGNGS